jgi:hypothetical protein
MIWLQTPPWGRWLLASGIVALAIWFELRPEPTVPHPFAIEDIARGELISSTNTRQVEVPEGMLGPVPPGSAASRDIPAGTPVLPADTDITAGVVPRGWWTIGVSIPEGSKVGDRVLVVAVDSGGAVEGVVSAVTGSDPFAAGVGSVAVPPDQAGAVAAAALDGRLVVMVSTG